MNPCDAIRAEKRRRHAIRARDSLLEFASFIRGPAFDLNWHINSMGHEIQEWAETPYGRLMIFAPPRHGKSEMVSRLLPAWLLGRNPDCKILSCSHTDSLATDLSLDLQDIIDSPEYREVFPGTRLKPPRGGDELDKAATRLVNRFTIVGRKGSYEAKSVGAAIVGKGFDYGIIDDPIADASEASSVVERAKLLRWFGTSFKTRAAPGAPILIMHQRWHLDDLAGTLIRQAKDPDADKYRIVSFPAVCEKVQDGDPRNPGEALWPSRYPLGYLNSQRATFTEADWLALYQQRPIAEGGALFKEHWFNNRWAKIGDYYVVGDRRYSREDLYVFMTADPSLGKRDGDSTGWVAAALTPCQRLLILEAGANRWTIEQMPGELYAVAMRHNAGFIGIEADGMQEQFARECRKVRGMPAIRELSHQGKDKKARAASAIVAAANGDILLPAEPYWDVHSYLQEMVSFTGADGDPDDRVDATIYAQSMTGFIGESKADETVQTESTPMSRRSSDRESRFWGS